MTKFRNRTCASQPGSAASALGDAGVEDAEADSDEAGSERGASSSGGGGGGSDAEGSVMAVSEEGGKVSKS